MFAVFILTNQIHTLPNANTLHSFGELYLENVFDSASQDNAVVQDKQNYGVYTLDCFFQFRSHFQANCKYKIVDLVESNKASFLDLKYHQ